MKKATAGTVAAALLITTPGFPAYQAMAAQIVVPTVSQSGASGAAGAAGVAPIGSVQAPLGNVSLTGAGLQTTLPSIPQANLQVTPHTRAALRVPGVQAAPQAAVQSRVGRAIIERAESRPQASKGLFSVLIHRIKGDKNAAAPAAQKWLAPSAENLGTPSGSKNWGADSFQALRGGDVAQRPAFTAPVQGKAVAPSRSFLKPSASSRNGVAEDSAQPPAPKRALPKQDKKKMFINLAVSLGVMAAAVAINVALGGGIPLPFIGTGAWIKPVLYGMIGTQVGWSIFQKVWEKRKAKKKDEVKKDAEKVSSNPIELSASKAAEALESGKVSDVRIFSFTTGEFHQLPVSPDLIAQVKEGRYQAVTDDAGAFFLVPVTQEEAPEAASKQDLDETPAAEEKISGEEAQGSAEKVEAPEAENQVQGREQKAESEAAPEQAPLPVIVTPRRRAGLYGAMIGSVLAMGASLVLPLESLYLPLLGWIAGELIGKRTPGRKRSWLSLAGAFAGMCAASAILAVSNLPVMAVAALPAIGSGIGYLASLGIDWARAKWSARDAAKAAEAAKKAIEAEKEKEAPAEEQQPEDGVVSAAKVKGQVGQVEGLQPQTEKKTDEPVEDQPTKEAPSRPRKGSNPSGLAGNAPRSFKTLPLSAQQADSQSILRGKARAQKRARRLFKDARLVRVAYNFEDGRAQPIYIFHSRKAKRVVTVYRTRVDVKSDVLPGAAGKGRWIKRTSQGSPNPLRSSDVLWGKRLEGIRSLRDAYTALKQDAHWFKPVRVELIPVWKEDPVYAFIDAQGRVRRVPAAVSSVKAKQGDIASKGAQNAPAAVQGADKDKKDSIRAAKVSPASQKKALAEERGPPIARAPPGNVPANGAEAQREANSPHLIEDLFGFRGVRGIARSPKLGRLPDDAGVPRIIKQISAQFGIERQKVLELGEKYGVTLAADRAVWLAVYDALQKANLAEYKQLDQKKYQGGVLSEAFGTVFHKLGWKKTAPKPSYRRLANKSYAKGWKGAALRMLELHKHIVGLVLRFPYHLFDMFVFGYFRRAISFEFFRGSEDFLTIRDRLTRQQLKEQGKWTYENENEAPLTERWLESAFQREMTRGAAFSERRNASLSYRRFKRWVITPLAAPLLQFVWRRATLAIFSAAAMGLVAGLVPLPVLGFHLTGLPVLGTAIMGIGHGIPMALSQIPFIGPGLALVAGNALNALIEDLSVGSILNTLTLSSALTFPAAVKQRLMDQRLGRLNTPRALSRAFFLGVLGTAFSWTFWSQNLKSMFGLMVVGAEIEGAMTYAGQLDGFVNPAYHSVTGSEFKLFHTMAAAVERPKGDSPIPFGGAITWGNIVIYKLQNLMGFNITDEVYWTVQGLAYGGHEGAASDAYVQARIVGDVSAPAVQASADLRDAPAVPGPPSDMAGVSVIAGVVGAATRSRLPEDAKFKLGSPEEMKARAEKAKRSVGEIEAEVAKVRERISMLELQVRGRQDRLSELEGQSKPLSPEEQARYDEVMRRLESKRDEEYVQSKLAEIYDLANPREGAADAQALQELLSYYTSLLPAATKDPGYIESKGVQVAVLKMVQNALVDFGADRVERSARKVSAVDEELSKRIEPIVAELEGLRGEARGELANRDALEKLLSAVSRIRNMALKERRGGSEMREFHKNLAKLATVMDLAFSLNTIEAAQKAIRDMQAMLDEKLAKIRGVQDQSEADRQQAEQDHGRVDEWNQEIDGKIDQDHISQNDMLKLEEQTRTAVNNIGGFRTETRALLARIDAEDSGQSPDAKTEYQRRLDLLPQLQDWYRNGKPGDEDFRSLSMLQGKLDDVAGYLESVDEGLDKLGTVPIEFAGVLVLAVPGIPEFNVSNPSVQQMIQLLNERKAHWNEELQKYKDTRQDFRNMLDPSYTGTELNDFGEPTPVSLHKYLAQEQDSVSKHSRKAGELTAEIDAAAALIRKGVPGADLPNLSGLDIDGLTDVIEAYPDKIKTLKFPNEDSDAVFDAKMALLKVATLLPQAGREVIQWNKSATAVEKIQEAMNDPVPQFKSLYENAVRALEAVIADADADIAYVSAGDHSNGANQSLIDRKRALLQSIRPVLLEADDALNDHAIPFTEDTIESYDPQGDSWARLFDAQKSLVEAAQEALAKTMPWALTAAGAESGDIQGGLAGIQTWRDKYQKYMDGYDDEAGHHTGILEYLDDIAKWKDPDNTEMHEVYGQMIPVSLPRLIDQMNAEQAQRAQEINTQHRQILDILGKLETLTKGRYALGSYDLPTDIQANHKPSHSKLDGMVQNEVYQNLADKLTAIADEYKDQAGNLDMGSSDDLIPSGTQPTPTADEATEIVLLALEAAKRLVPSSNTSPESAPAAYAVARYMYNEAARESAEINLSERIPHAEAVLGEAKTVISGAIADLDKDEAYVRSNGESESADSVYDRKVRIYGQLNSVTRSAAELFGAKVDWDDESYDTVGSMEDYYDATTTVYENSGTVTDSEIEAITKFRDALQDTYDDLEAQRKDLVRWMAQLNDPRESALNRVAQDLKKVQEKTRAVLEANVKYRDLEARLKRSEDIIQWNLSRSKELQGRLASELGALRDAGSLDPELRHRIDQLRVHGKSWMVDGAKDGDAAAIVIPKREFASFIETLFGHFLENAASTRDLGALRQRLMENPSSISEIIPDSQLLEFGDADGFYLVYQSQFSVPHGLETSNWVTLGNVARVWGNNISVTGYQFASPNNEENAPWGDKGVEVQVESLQGKNWVNYLNIDFHRFVQDIPADSSMASTAGESRILLFEDFAVLLFGDRLYVGVTGFGDFATTDSSEKPSFYGGSVKTSLKLTEVMRLNAEQQQVFAKDPRYFLQTINLDLTHLDEDLNRDFVIESHGENKHYKRTEVGPSFDIAKLLGDKSGDSFTLDLYWARQEGTDDYDQDMGGVTVLKSFTLRDDSGKPWMVISNKAGAERGTEYNTYSDRVQVNLPDWGVAISAEGRIIGDAKTYYGEVAKQTGSNSSISLGYGRRYVGQPDRLYISMNTSFTLGELWRAVADETADELKGSKALAGYNKELDDFFKANEDDRRVAELRSVFRRDIGAKLITQDAGKLAKDIEDLRRAGAILDNSRVNATVGFVSHPISDELSDRVVGGGFTAGTNTTMTMTKLQRELIDSKMASLYRESLRLQFRMLELTKQWQETVTEIAQSQWELKLASFMAQNAPTDALREEGLARKAEAELRLRQATIRYNMLSGRSPDDVLPFDDLSTADLDALLREIRSLVASPEGLTDVLGGLDPASVKAQMGKDPFTLMKWIPWIEQVSVSFGAQLQDNLANQVLGLGASVRLPIYDPGSKEKNQAYVLQRKATLEEIAQVYEDYALRAERELAESEAWTSGAALLAPGLRSSADGLADAIRGYRNGLMPESRLRDAFSQWRWYASGYLLAESRRVLTEGWSALDARFGRGRSGGEGNLRIGSFQQAFDAAAANSRSLAEIEARRQAAVRMAEANSKRIQKFYMDLHFGYNITADGVGWLPSFGVTGIAVTPILTFELKSSELADLQKRQGQGQAAYYANSRAKVANDLAVDFYRLVVQLTQAHRAAGVLEGEIIPGLRAELTAAQRSSADGDPTGKVAQARRELDGAVRRLQLAKQVVEQTAVTINHLLGRPADAPFQLAMTPEAALAELQRILGGSASIETDRAVLDARIETARAVETMVDKDLKVEELRLEPVSMAVRSLGRLIHALGDETIGNPELMAAARVQTLEAERARESYDRDIELRRAELRRELAAAKAGFESAGRRGDAEGRLKAMEWAGRIRLAEAGLLRLGAAPVLEGPAHMPRSFGELEQRVLAAEQTLADSGKETGLEVFEPEYISHKSGANFRYFHHVMTLSKESTGKDYAEGWVELRLRDRQTPSEVLMALAKLRMQRADMVRQNDSMATRAQAQILLSQFVTNVQLLRWAESLDRAPVSKTAREEFQTFVDELRSRIGAQGVRIAALLALPQGSSTEALMRLVPEDRTGSSDISRLAGSFVEEASRLPIEQIRKTIFEGGLPQKLGNPDSLINQIRANTIAERMSYKGFTPVLAFGIFRGVQNSGVFLEAPDPRSIERSLQAVLSDSVRRELESQGRMQEMSLKLHLLMSSVAGRSKVVERMGARVAAEQDNYYAVAAQVDAGLAPRTELLAAQDALVRAWLDLSSNAAELKNDFIRLVSELEAIGYDDSDLLKVPAAAPELPQEDLRGDPVSAILTHLSRRMLDADFSQGLEGTLRRAGIPAQLVEDLERDAAVYRKIDKTANQVRHHQDIGTAEKLDLLTRADTEGRRENVKARLAAVLSLLGTDVGARRQVFAFLSADLDRALSQADGVRARELKLVLDMRAFMIRGLELPFAVRGAVDRLEALHTGMLDAKQTLLESYMSDRSGDAGRFVLQDAALDQYLSAVKAYDAEVVKTFQMPEVKDGGDMTVLLNNLYPAGESITRKLQLAKYGRGMLAIDALIMLQEARLSAYRFERAPPSQWKDAMVALQRLKDLRRSWESKDPRGLEPLYAKTQVDSQGRRLWTADDWYTGGELKLLIESGRVEPDAQGRMWLRQDAKRFEIVAGVDAALIRRDLAREVRGRSALRASLGDVFEKHPFALVRLDGKGAEGIGYDEALAKARSGRVFHFQRSADGFGLHPAVHPLRGLWEDPAGTETVIYMGDESYSRDRFPTLESLQDHIQRLARSGKADDAAGFYRLESGPEGVALMVEAAREHEARSRTLGWMGVKLQSYGFAAREDGQPAELYLTKDDFETALKALRDAPGILRDARGELEEALAEKAAKLEVRKEHKARVDAEGLVFKGVEAGVREEIEAAVAAGADYRRRQGETEAEHQLRVKQRVQALVVEDQRFIRAQKALSGKVEDYNKVEDAYFDSRRRADKALDAYKRAGVLIAHAGQWETLGDGYLKGLEAAGLSEEDVLREAAKLTKDGKRRLFVTRDAALYLDGAGRLTRFTASPVFGSGVLNATIRRTGGPVRRVSGEVFAAVMDHDASLVHLYMDMDSVERAGKQWRIEDVNGSVRYMDQDGRRIDPTFRLKNYVETFDDGTALPVMLNRRYLISTLEGAGREVSETSSWSYGPMNWGNILLEIPRGLAQAPVELLTGRDPNQHNYLGRANMYKLEGGATQHHGFFRKALGVLDILDIMPDPVDWYFDASQFPDSVRLDSSIRPGQTIYDKDARFEDKGVQKDVHFGTQHAQRTVVYETEHLVSAGRRVLSYFQGGVQNTWVEEVRGRGVDEATGRSRTFSRSRIEEEVGLDALKKALADPSIGSHNSSYETDADAPVRLTEAPGHIEVDRVERSVRVRPGAEQFGEMAEKLDQLPPFIRERIEAARKALPELDALVSKTEKVYGERVGDLDAVRRGEAGLWDEAHRLSWRIGAQRALEAEMARLRSEIAELQAQLGAAKSRLSQLLEELADARRREEEEGGEQDPDHGSPFRPWVPVVIVLSLAAVIVFLEWLRRRKAVSPLPA